MVSRAGTVPTRHTGPVTRGVSQQERTVLLRGGYLLVSGRAVLGG